MLHPFKAAPQEQPNLSPIKQRLLETAEQFKEEIPFHVQMILNPILSNFTDFKIEDETIVNAIAKVRAICDYVENGQPVDEVEPCPTALE